ncbi:hypothetical protein B296_00017485 [Ensete ventricosum]|uniref:Uncharacterized protein n=1 Tax=Ensete ventricosum TaxID=4639 RepID=A0A426XHX1_ENSVE|nr:hypothetical protein B296_00017485 [Ensete ventricosum]
MFPNSGIRAKGRPTTTSPHAGLATHDQGPLQGGGRLRLRPARKGGRRCSRGQQLARVLPMGTADCDQPAGATVAHLQRSARKAGRL